MRRQYARTWIVLGVVLVAVWFVAQSVQQGAAQRRAAAANAAGAGPREPVLSPDQASRDVRADRAPGAIELPEVSSAAVMRQAQPAKPITDRRVVVVPVGVNTTEAANSAARYLQRTLAMPVTVAAAAPVTESMLLPRRQQVDSDELLRQVRDLHPMSQKSTALVVALSPGDLVSDSHSWDALYSYRIPATGYAVINLPRLGVTASATSVPGNPSVAAHRLQVQLARLVGAVQLGIAPDARVGLFGPVLDLQDMDVRNPNLCAARDVARTLRRGDLRC